MNDNDCKNNLSNNQNFSYIDYKEMKLAIEALGGEYEDDRNFSKDKFFKKLKSN